MQSPHVVMLVGNDVSRDSRVKKSAAAVAAAGARVTVVGMSPVGYETLTRMGDVTIRRVPLEHHHRESMRTAGGMSKAEYIRRRSELRREIAEAKADRRSATADVRDDHRRRKSERDDHLRERLDMARERVVEAGRRRSDEQQRLVDEATADIAAIKQEYADWRTANKPVPPALDRVHALRMKARVESRRRVLRARIKRLKLANQTDATRLRAERWQRRRRHAMTKDLAERRLERERGRAAASGESRVETAREELEALDAAWRDRDADVAAVVAPDDGEVRWRGSLPTILDMTDAYVPVVRELDPDVVHAHDVHVVGIGALATRAVRATGKDVTFIYDAHEYVPGMALADPVRLAAYVDLEREFIGDADAVVTVSEPLAELLRRDHALDANSCRVVLNAPLPVEAGHHVKSLRDVVGLSTDTPLVVYSGGATEARGLLELVDAMTLLPTVHLALVSNLGTVFGQEVQRRIAEQGLQERVHVAPMVASEDVPQYLASADLGIHPLRDGFINHEIALPNKLFEYLHAGLPIVCSDVKAMRTFVERHGTGVIFRAGDANDLARAIRDGLDRLDDLRTAVDDEDLRIAHSWDAQAERLATLYADLDVLPAPNPVTGGTGPRLRDVGPDRRARRAVLAGPINAHGRLSRLLLDDGVSADGLGVVDVIVQAVAGTPGAETATMRVGSARLEQIRWQTRHTRRVLASVSHVIAESGQSPFGRLNGGRLLHDLPMLRSHAIRAIAVVGPADLDGDGALDVAALREAGAVLASFDAATATALQATWLPVTVPIERSEAELPSRLVRLAGPTDDTRVDEQLVHVAEQLGLGYERRPRPRPDEAGDVVGARIVVDLTTDRPDEVTLMAMQRAGAVITPSRPVGVPATIDELLVTGVDLEDAVRSVRGEDRRSDARTAIAEHHAPTAARRRLATLLADD